MQNLRVLLSIAIAFFYVFVFSQNAKQTTLRDSNNYNRTIFITEDNNGYTSVITTVKPFELAVKMGQVPGYSAIDKFGVNLNITTATDPEDVWEFGGMYNYDTNGTAPIKYLSSSSTADTQTIQIVGLDVDGYEVIQNIKLTGQTNVNLTDSLWRVYRMQNQSSVSLVGIVYCHTDAAPTDGVPLAAKVRAVIDDGNNQTLMSLYTIPRGKVGFLYRGEIGIHYESATPTADVHYAHCHYESRRYGKVFTIKKAVTVLTHANSIFQDVRSFPDPIPALTDIKILAEEVTTTLGLFATFDIMLVDESVFTENYLNLIGQP